MSPHIFPNVQHVAHLKRDNARLRQEREVLRGASDAEGALLKALQTKLQGALKSKADKLDAAILRSEAVDRGLQQLAAKEKTAPGHGADLDVLRASCDDLRTRLEGEVAQRSHQVSG
eukprot:m.276071 g.276071  ORF g.276071 m.276071 type:complete len:117 (+) comp19362_c0_seq4:115-465(+)